MNVFCFQCKYNAISRVSSNWFLKMSNNQVQQHKKNASAAGEIKHTTYLSEHIGALYLNSNYSDLLIKVEDEEFYAHKVILAARSDYFR